MHDVDAQEEGLEPFTKELFDELFSGREKVDGFIQEGFEALASEIGSYLDAATASNETAPIITLFESLKRVKDEKKLSPEAFGIKRETLFRLAERHRELDEHGVTVGGRVGRALKIVKDANARVQDYMETNKAEAPSGIDLWEKIQENTKRIKSVLKMDDDTWNSYSGQVSHCIDSAATLSKIIDLSPEVRADIDRVTLHYRMRLTPYYASLIQPHVVNDPVLIQSVPTAEMVDNCGIEIPPVAADHSPARLVDQFYPRVVSMKATNMCAMYCTHCLRIAHIGKKDHVYPSKAYEEALAYVRSDPYIRDVLITGGDAFVLPNKVIRKLLGLLDEIDHVRTKRLGTRIPLTAPQRIDDELLEILAVSNDKKPLRVVTQINTAQEITPVSREAFKNISSCVAAVLNQAVLLKGVNDTNVKMWKLCETIHESYVRPYYLFNGSYRNPQFAHLRVPIEKGRDIVESMYGNISGDAIPRYIATAGGKIPLHRDNVVAQAGKEVTLKKPWSGEQVIYPDADLQEYNNPLFSFARYTS